MRVVWLSALIFGVALLLLPFVFKLDGKPHATWEQFLGRFHPLLIHIPIGLIVLVPVLEIAGTLKPALREAAGFVLSLSFISCVGAVILGYLLAYGSGTAGAIMTKHMWGGIALTISVMICTLVRPIWASGGTSRVYPAFLASVLLVLSWAAHQGGSLTHGSNYLTEYMPLTMKRWLLLGSVQAAPNPSSFYAMHIHPVLDSNCVTCHGEGNIKGGLRLNTYEQLMKGGKDGQVIIPGKPESSLLLLRVTLPEDHKQFMPAEGRPPLKPEEIEWIRAWIRQGASSSATTLAGILIHEPKDLPLTPVPDYSALMLDIRQMDQEQGAKLVQVSKNPADGLILNTVDVAETFGDAQLAGFEKFAPYIVEAELGRTAVTDASCDTLAKFTNLHALHLEGTAITGDRLEKLAPLSQLAYLNLSGTRVTAKALSSLTSLKNLRRVYSYDTPAQPGPAVRARERSVP
jgi:uncharacterized membrane protein